MKSTKVLAVLAGTALLAACSQEELVESNNIPQQMEEIVGAKLVGTDISMEVSMNGSSAQSRYAGGESGWGNEDVIGFGWIVSGNASDTQSPNNKPSSALWANHMFGTEDGGTTWSTKGNLYEGWYYAYYPWSYEKKAGNIKTYTMNPAMIARGANKHYSQSLYLSNRQFVTEGDIDKENNSMSDNIKLYQAVKFIQITAKAENESAFSKDGGLDNLQIDKVTISAGDKNIFAEEVYVYGKELPVKVKYSEDMTKTETDNLNLANFRQNYSSIVPVKKAATTISRDVKAAELLVSTNPTSEGKNVNVYLNVRPTTNNTLTADDITVTFHSGAASFVISKAKSLSDINKEAIDALVAAYHKDGKLSTINELDEEGNPKATLAHLPLTFELCAADFVTDFSSITDITEWNEAVELVSLLKREQETFYIDGNIEFDGAINMPEGCELTVIPVDNEDVDETEILTDNMITLKGTFENGIPANLNIEAVDVVVEGTVEEAQTINAHCITNNGTLNLGKGTSVNAQKELAVKVTNNGVINMAEYSMLTNVDNKNRINIVYKSAIELAVGGANGEVAYEVTNLDTPTRIKNVLKRDGNNTGRHALVNVLVFNSENKISEFNFTYNVSTEADDDYYNSTPGFSDDKPYEGLNEVSLEINGVNVSSTKEVTVKNVEINNANLGAGIVVGGDLIVKGGNVIADVASIGALNIEDGKGKIVASTIGSVNIDKGSFTIEAQTIEGDVTATGENYFIVGVINGDNVVLTNNSNTTTHIEGTTIKGNVTLNGSWDLRGVTFKGNLTVNGAVKSKDLTIDNTLTVNEGAKFGISGEDATISHIKNYGELTTSVNVYAKTVRIYDRSDANVATGMTIWYTEPTEGQYGYTQEGTTHGRILYFGAQWASTFEELQNAIDAAVEGENVILFGGDIEGTLTVTQKKDVKITIDGRNHQLAGSIIVDGKSACFETAALNISNIDFRGTTSETVFINLGVSGNNATRYTNHVTVDGCTFEGEECVAIKSYTGGDKNLKINNCVVAKNMHSFVQVANVKEGLEIANSQVYSKNGVNLNATLSLLMDKCTFDVRGYAVRLGQGTNVAGEGKAFEIKNSALKSACEESDDAVIVFRGDAKKATLTLVNTSITGEPQFKGEEVATIIK